MAIRSLRQQISQPDSSVIDWLLDSDSSIRWQVMHDLLDAPARKVTAERAKIAGVFVNRLKKGMPLQTDPTVIYAITKGEHKNDGKGPLGRRLLRKDLDIDSPYNTYKYPGLPKGPICNPGKEAIVASVALFLFVIEAWKPFVVKLTAPLFPFLQEIDILKSILPLLPLSCYVLGTLLFIWIIYRLWKRALLPLHLDAEPSLAIKGPMAFGPQDGAP